MPVYVTKLNASIDALTKEVASTEGVEASAVALITGVAAEITKAVTAALTADAAANTATIAAANQAITDVTARFVAARTPLAAAITAA